MTRSLILGATYFLVVFAVAFALGTLRVTFVVPAVGTVWATLAELPFTLAASWAICAWLCRRWPMSSLAQAASMGASAFVLLMGAEVAGGILIFGRSLEEHVGLYGTVAGVLGLFGQIAFGVFPIVQYSLSKAVVATDKGLQS
jgi:hypothetical protein